MKTNNSAAIGIFDSGLGGLTVVSAVRKLLPNENIIYLGDTARVPYGDKSTETIKRYGCENALFLSKHDVKLVIAACNTVSSTAMDAISSNFKLKNIQIPILGVVEAGVSCVVKAGVKDIAVIGTRATISGMAYEKAIGEKIDNARIRSIACPLFAPIVEEGLANHEIARCSMDFYLSALLKSPPDALLLGCTHYPLLADALNRFFKFKVQIIDSAIATAFFAKEFLRNNGLERGSGTLGFEKFFVTDSPESFARHAGNFLGKEIKSINRAVIDF